MTDEERKSRFQVIRKPQRLPLEEEVFLETASQGLLFPVPRRDLLIFVVFPLVTENDFKRMLELSKPTAILELRRSPRFDIGHLNRHLAFRWFESTHSKYYDLTSAIHSEPQSAADPVELVGGFLSRAGKQVSGPVVILISQTYLDKGSSDDVLTRIAKLFTSASEHPWRTIELPRFA